MNYRFNIEEWLPRFPLRPEYGRFSGMFVASPSQICNNEQLRQAARDQYDWGPAVPVDVFIMADGEPQDRHVTKVGGLPYRPASLPWPCEADGSPLTFLAQFDFTDSFDIVGDLPGEVLLVFTPDNNEDGPVETLHFEWHSLGMTELISANEIPVQRWRFKPCYGYRHRTVSYPQAKRRPKFDANRYPMCQGREIWSDYHLLQFQAMQIGKAPFFIQREDEQFPGRMLCTINSVCIDVDTPFPWINHPEALASEASFAFDDYLMICDAGCIYISIDEAGILHSRMSCY